MTEQTEDRLKAQLKLRLPEVLRAALAAKAEVYERSLNGEIVARLEMSLRDEAMGGTVFRDRDTFAILDELCRLLFAIELTTGHRWNEGDPIAGRDMLLEALRAMLWLVENGPALLAGQPLPMLRDVHAQYGFETLRAMVEKDTKRRRERSESERDAAAEPSDEAAE